MSVLVKIFIGLNEAFLTSFFAVSNLTAQEKYGIISIKGGEVNENNPSGLF